MGEFLSVERRGKIAILTMIKPESMNAIGTHEDCQDIIDTLRTLGEDRSVSAIILTGSGKAFSAGGNLKGMQDRTGIGVLDQPDSTRANYRKGVQAVIRALMDCEVPMIAAVNGHAIGLGCDLACTCDIRIAAESAKMAAAFVKRGIVPESGGTWILPRLLGWAKAAELIFTGRTLSAKESLELGLVNHVVPDAELAAKTREIALEMAANAPLAVQSAKRLMRMGLTETFNDHVHHVYLQFLQLIRTSDFKEGMTSFLEKRPADFQGR